MEASIRFKSARSALVFKKKIALMYFLYKTNEKKNRKYWVHPLNLQRSLYGAFSNMMMTLREHDEKFFNYFRMSQKSFDELSVRLGESLKGKETNMRVPISPLEMLAVTLRYLGSGCSIMDLHYSYRLGHSTVCKLTRKVCTAIWEVLKDECFPTFSEERWLQIAAVFEKSANFPNCLGALDGKHVRITKPTGSGSLYFNYKKFFSIVLFAIADANYNFIYIDVGSYGREGDSTVYQNSSFFKKLSNNSLNIPTNSRLPNSSNGVSMPYVFVGDDAFGLSTHIMRPYRGKTLSKNKLLFNYRLSRARRFVECTFGILSNKWRIFHRPMDVKLEFAVQIVKTCCLLHNFVRARDGYNFGDILTINGLNNGPQDMTEISGQSQHKISQVNEIRSEFARYFENEGKVSWQDGCINSTSY